jgi:starch synthase (maltosyl-transferring)
MAERTLRPVNQRDATRRVVIENVRPQVDGGRFAAKRTVGDLVAVEADIFADGHDELAAVLRYRNEASPEWCETPMELVGNDRWQGTFAVPDVGRYRFTVTAWVDRFATWRRDLAARLEAGQDVSAELLVGVDILTKAARRITGPVGKEIRAWASRVQGAGAARSAAAALDPRLAGLMTANPDRRQATSTGVELPIAVDRVRARFGAWYELFPRSASPDPNRPGTLRDVIDRLPSIAAMGFDVLYLPPIHPIGLTNRKGRNNTEDRAPGDPGSPWAIGSEEGGHTAVASELGSLEDLDELLGRAKAAGLEVALDLAFQCSPDHPYTKEHPEWFRHRPDGTIRYAENPPKRYQDIYPLDFETKAWRGLWEELRSVAEFWIGRGVRIFRVDNPHTKPFAFWEWLIGSLKEAHPDLIFLSEAFTKPKVMYRLAKLGFSQSYTYFAWRTAKWELEQYFTELTSPPVIDFFRANLWPNTPDILTEQLQLGGRPAFVSRLILAATLGASFGIFGPAFELMEHRPLVEGREEYLDSEKYQVRHWDLDDPDSLADLITRMNGIRHDHPALQRDDTLRFHPVDDDGLIAYSKTSPDGRDVVLTVVNLDPRTRRSGWVDVPTEVSGVLDDRGFGVRDLITGARYTWHGGRNFVDLDPFVIPAHVLHVEGRT